MVDNVTGIPNFFRFIAYLFGVFFFFGLITQSGPKIESLFFPVVKILSVEEIVDQTDGSKLFRFKAEKLRDCISQATSWYYIKSDHVTVPVEITKTSKNSGRPPGIVLSSWWTLPSDAPFPGDYYMYVTFNCRFPWATTQTLGPFHLSH